MMNLHNIPKEMPLHPTIPARWVRGIAAWQHNHWIHQNNVVLVVRNNQAIDIQFIREDGTRGLISGNNLEEWERVHPGHQIDWDRLTVEHVL